MTQSRFRWRATLHQAEKDASRVRPAWSLDHRDFDRRSLRHPESVVDIRVAGGSRGQRPQDGLTSGKDADRTQHRPNRIPAPLDDMFFADWRHGGGRAIASSPRGSRQTACIMNTGSRPDCTDVTTCVNAHPISWCRRWNPRRQEDPAHRSADKRPARSLTQSPKSRQ